MRFHQRALRAKQRNPARPLLEVVQRDGKIAARDADHLKSGVQQLVPLLALQYAELEDLDEIDAPDRQIHQQRAVWAAIEMRVPDRCAETAALVEQRGWKRVRFFGVGQFRANAQRPDQLAA